MNRTLITAALLAVSALSLLSGCSNLSNPGDCRYTSTRSGHTPVGEAKRLRVQNQVGNLTVRGVSGATEVTYTAKICARTGSQREQVQIILEPAGEAVRLATNLMENDPASVDFEVQVPTSMQVVGENMVGDADVSQVADLDLSVRAGNITAEDITVGVTLKDSAGNLTVTRVKGSVLVDSGAGNVTLTDTTGDITMHDKPAGNIRINGAGSVDIERAGVGNVDIQNVKGDLRIGSMGPGNLRYSGIGGHIEVPNR